MYLGQCSSSMLLYIHRDHKDYMVLLKTKSFWNTASAIVQDINTRIIINIYKYNTILWEEHAWIYILRVKCMVCECIISNERYKREILINYHFVVCDFHHKFSITMSVLDNIAALQQKNYSHFYRTYHPPNYIFR